jgi:biotin carboxyl carrier protein
MPTEVPAHITGTVWKIGKRVGEPFVISEAMKMEEPLESAVAGRVVEMRCKPSQAVTEGDVLVVLE